MATFFSGNDQFQLAKSSEPTRNSLRSLYCSVKTAGGSGGMHAHLFCIIRVYWTATVFTRSGGQHSEAVDSPFSLVSALPTC